MLHYSQTQGKWTRDGICFGSGYSGFGEGLNNPEKQDVENLGPIPCGDWDISGPPFDSPEHGPYCLRLTPRKGTETYGRKDFLLHGDEKLHPGEHLASHGCIVSDRTTRRRVYQTGDTFLRVIPN